MAARAVETTIAVLLDAGTTSYDWTLPSSLAWGDTYSMRVQVRYTRGLPTWQAAARASCGHEGYAPLLYRGACSCGSLLVGAVIGAAVKKGGFSLFFYAVAFI